MRPITRVHARKLVPARITLDPKSDMRHHMTRNTRPLHMRLRTLAPQTTRRHLPATKAVKEREMVGDARLVAFDPHPTGRVGEVPETFVDVEVFVGTLEGGGPGFFVDEVAVASDDGARGRLWLLLVAWDGFWDVDCGMRQRVRRRLVTLRLGRGRKVRKRRIGRGGWGWGRVLGGKWYDIRRQGRRKGG